MWWLFALLHRKMCRQYAGNVFYQGRKNEGGCMETSAIITLLFAIIILVGAIYCKIQGKKQEDWKTNQTVDFIIFCALLFVGFAIRVWQFGMIPDGMNQDGAMAAVDAKALADHGTDRYGMYMPVHFTAWGYGQMSVLLSYMMVPFIKVFGLNAVTARMPMLIVSILGIVAIYFVVKRIGGIRMAQIAMLITALNPWHFMQSRWALDCNVFPHMLLFGILFLLLGLEKRRYLYISMIFFALCMYSYGISFYTVPLFLLFVCIWFLVKKWIKIKDALISVGVYVLISWPIYLTMIINTFKLKTIKTPFFTMAYFKDSVRSQDILFFADDKVTQLKANVKALINVLLQKDDLPWNTVTGFGTMFLFMMPFVVAGIVLGVLEYRKTENEVKKAALLCVYAALGTALWAGVITATVNVNRVNIIFYPMIVFAAMGVFFVYERRKAFGAVVAALYLILSFGFLNTYFTTYKDTLATQFFAGFMDSLDDIKDSKCTVYCITPDSQYSGSWNVSEILTLFEHNIDAKFYQGKTKENGYTYSQKYFYYNASQLQLDASQPIAYVISNADLSLFSETQWKIETHGNFSAVIPLSYVKK